MGSDSFAVVWCAAVAVAVVVLLAAIVVSDLRNRRIPNVLVAGLAGAWAALHIGLFACGVPVDGLSEVAYERGVPDLFLAPFRAASPVLGLLTALVLVIVLWVAASFYERFSGKTAMGAGDVKLIGALALFAGPVRSLTGLAVACLAALAFCAFSRDRTFPFAPALALGFVCAMTMEL